jgi:hypothetical protein
LTEGKEDHPMSELKTSRPYQERFLDGFDRSRLRQEVQATKPRRFAGLRKKYATIALGASLAFGGIGVPMTMLQNQKASGPQSAAPDGASGGASSSGGSLNGEIASDLRTAQSIAQQVAGGVEAAVGGLGSAASAPVNAVAEAPQRLKIVTDSVKEQFFKKEVPFGSIIYNEAKKNDINPELVAAVVRAESRFQPTARSGAGAIGLMQLVPRTGKWMGAKDLTNPQQNIAAGAKYLKYLHGRFNGNETKVIAAYNAGEGNVRRFNGVPPFRETRNYVAKVKNYQQEFGNRASTHVANNAAAAELAALGESR